VTTVGLHPDYPALHNTTTDSFIPESCFIGPVRSEANVA
jgi:hypothetical protein